MSRLESRVKALLMQGIGAAAFPAAAAQVIADGRRLATVTAGTVTRETLWDVASLTKPMVTATALMRGLSQGWLPSLDMPLRGRVDAQVTVRQLLSHRSGLPAHIPLWVALDERLPGWRPGEGATLAAVAELLRAEVATAEAGSATLYSDLGYILLGWHIEHLTGRTLAASTPFAWGTTAEPAEPARYAPTGVCPARRRRLYGEVNDINAWLLGGVAGHAGVFATVDDVGDWALDLWCAAEGRPPRGAAPHTAGIDGGVVREFWDLSGRRPGQSWVLGWDTPTPGASSAGSAVGPNAVGHLGFTGTSVWIDRDHALIVVLLTNRVDLGANAQDRLKKFRPMFHDAVRELLASRA